MAKSATATKKAPTKSEVYGAIADQTDLSKKQVGSVIDALNEQMVKSLKKNGMFTLPGVAKMSVKKKPATTQATTKASTQPATQPRKRRKPTTATAPTTRPTTKTSSTPGQSVCRSTTVSAVPDYLAVQAGWCADESGAALGSRGSPALCRGVGWVF